MIRVIISCILILSVGFIIVQVVNFFLSINSGSAQTKVDLAEMKSKIVTYVSSLVPMTDTELELLSINQSGTATNRGLTSIKSGAFTSIYNEPLLAYAYKEYKYPADKSMLLISSESDDFIYLSNGPQTKVFVNDMELGLISENGDLYDPNGEQLLAHIEIDQNLSTHPVKIGDREVGEIVNPKLNQSPNPRAYQFLEPMNDEESKIFKALTFLSLLEETL